MLPKKLTQFVASMAETTVYEVPAGNYTMLKEIVVANNTATAQTLSMSLVPDGSTPGPANRILPATSIAPNTVTVLDFTMVMAAGDYLTARASAPGALTVTISGVEDPGDAVSAGTSNFASTGMVVTSTARPSSPYVGQFIYESDTGRMLVWNGYSWAASQIGAQVLGYAELTSGGPVVYQATVDIPNMSVTVTVPAGRRLRLTGYTYVENNNAGVTVAAYIEIAEGATRLHFDQQALVQNAGGAGNGILHASVVITPSAGSHTYKLRLGASSNVNWYAGTTYPTYLLVEDITGDPMPVAVNSVPVGVLAQARITTNQANIGAGEVDLVGYSVNVVVPAGRTLKVSARAYFSGGNITLNDYVIKIYRGGTMLTESRVQLPNASGYAMVADPMVLDSPPAGAHTYRCTTFRVFGSDAGTNNTSALYPGYLVVEDVTPTPAAASSAPSGTLAYAEKTSQQAAITTEVAVTGLTATVTVAAGRRLRVSAFCHMTSNTVDTGAQIRLKQDGTEIQFAEEMTPASGRFDLSPVAVVTPSAGTHTYTVTALRTGASNTVTVDAWTTDPCFLLVEDITPASVYPVPISNGLAVVTSGTRPTSTSEGLAIFETDTDRIMLWDGAAWGEFGRIGAWTNFTPNVDQGATTNIAKTVTYSRYQRHGRMITFAFHLVMTGTGTASSTISVGIPFAAAMAGAERPVVGSAQVFNSSANQFFQVHAALSGGVALIFYPSNAIAGVGTQFLGLSQFTEALAVNDFITGTVTYEAAS